MFQGFWVFGCRVFGFSVLEFRMFGFMWFRIFLVQGFGFRVEGSV